MPQRADEISKNIISILKKDSESINYFQNEIERIEKLNVSWKQNIIRVGIIGITSSGKSTLLNAILGEDLLPGKVAPTSGVIVGSMKGDVFKVNIKYNDGITENILNKKQTRKKLLTLADEKNNPNNVYNVNQIEIKSPKFIPPYNDLKILDSPGLNACNLETHEKITYEQLLGEIDICVFLTSLKGNADKDDHVILQKIDDSNLEYNKTVIVVQNKLDSVRSKPGRREGIAKTKDQVIIECGERIRRLCEGLKMNPIFCQISAIEALNGRLFNNRIKEKSSRINEFLEKITEAYEKEKIQRDIKRIRQIARLIVYINKIINHSIRITEDKFTGIYKEEEEIDILKGNYENVNNEFKILKSKIKKTYEDWRFFIKECIEKLENCDPYDLKSANNLVVKIKNDTEKIRNDILDEIKIFKRSLFHLIDNFNLIPEDLDVSNHIFEKGSIIDFGVELSEEEIRKNIPNGKKRLKPKPGIFNKILRFIPFVELGYDKVDDFKVEILIKKKINFTKSKRNINYLTKIIYDKDESAINKFELIFKYQLTEIKNELDNKIKNISDKKNKLISTEVLKSIEFELNSILDSYDLRKFIEAESYEILKLPDNSIRKQENPTLYEIPTHIYSMYRITELKTKYLFDRIWNSVLTMYSDKSKPVIIWAWDYDPIIDFSNLFIYDNKINEEKLKDSGFETEMINNNQYIYVDRNKISDDTILKNNLHKYEKFGVNIFTILNISNYGSVKNNIIKDDKVLTSILKDKNNKCNWIYNDLQNEISSDNNKFNSDSLEEVTKLFIEFSDNFNKNNGCYLINDANPVYSLLFLEYRNIKNESDSINIKSEILKNNNVNPYVNNAVKKHIEIISKTFQELNSTKNGK